MYRNLVGNIERNWSAEGGRVLLVCCEDVVPSPPRDLNEFHPKESASTSDQNFRCLNRPVSKESRTRPLLMLGASTMKNCGRTSLLFVPRPDRTNESFAIPT